MATNNRPPVYPNSTPPASPHRTIPLNFGFRCSECGFSTSVGASEAEAECTHCREASVEYDALGWPAGTAWSGPNFAELLDVSSRDDSMDKRPPRALTLPDWHKETQELLIAFLQARDWEVMHDTKSQTVLIPGKNQISLGPVQVSSDTSYYPDDGGELFIASHVTIGSKFEASWSQWVATSAELCGHIGKYAAILDSLSWVKSLQDALAPVLGSGREPSICCKIDDHTVYNQLEGDWVVNRAPSLHHEVSSLLRILGAEVEEISSNENPAENVLP